MARVRELDFRPVGAVPGEAIRGEVRVFEAVEENRVSRLIRKMEALQRTLETARRTRVRADKPRLPKWGVTQHRACPLCQCTKILRSHRRNRFERMLTYLMLPYRCDACGIRFFRTRF